jgi:hypothetical protein
MKPANRPIQAAKRRIDALVMRAGCEARSAAPEIDRDAFAVAFPRSRSIERATEVVPILVEK